MLRRTFMGLAAVLMLSTASLAAYPERPITLVVAFAAGGPTDVIARIVAEDMSKTLGQQIVVENTAGAGGTTATAKVAGAAADGYTLIMGQMGTHAAAPSLYESLKYNPVTDFTPVGMAEQSGKPLHASTHRIALSPNRRINGITRPAVPSTTSASL